MKVRQATIKDVRELSRLNAYVQRMHADSYPEIFKSPENDEFAATFFVAMLEDPEMIVYLAEEEGSVIGYLLMSVRRQPENPFMYSHNYLQIDHIGVMPEYQGKGVGKALMARAEELAEQEGMDYVGLDTWDFNTTAHKFFFSQGYQTFNLRMWKKLEG